MFPLIAGLFGVVMGLLSSPNPVVAIICGSFLALVAWAMTGFKLSGTTSPEKTSALTQEPSKQDESPIKPEIVVQPDNVATNSDNPAIKEVDHQWRNFKVKAFLVVSAVLVAANYERCTETPLDRARRDTLSSQRIQSISRDEAQQDCQKDDGHEQECREAAQRALELAREKTKAIYGQ